MMNITNLEEVFPMYRRNKFNEAIDVRKYECGSCKFYEFEREDKANYCNQYQHSYYMNDQCQKYWELSDDVR